MWRLTMVRLAGAMLLLSLGVATASASTAAELEFAAIRKEIPQNWWDGGWDQRAALESFLQRYPSETLLCSKAQYWLGAYFYSIRDYTQALDAFKLVVASYPTTPDAAQAQFEMGQLYRNALEDYDLAAQCYQKVINTYPKNNLIPISYVMLGRTYRDKGDTAKAVAAWQKVLSDFPWADRQRVEAAIELGDLALSQNNARQALSHYKQAYLVAPASDLNLTNWVLDKIYTGFKHLDLSVVRANLFLKFQKFGPEGEDGVSQTADDLSNPLAEF